MDTSEQKKPATNRPPRKRFSAPRAIYGKDDQRYWRERLRKRVVRRGGRIQDTAQWYARIQHAGREERFNLAFSNREEAAKRARDIYLSLRAQGWDATIARYKAEPTKSRKTGITIGEYMSEVERLKLLEPKTFQCYCRKLRTLTAGALDISTPSEAGERAETKFSYKTGGTERWRQQIDSTKLARLNPQKIEAWKKSYIERNGRDPVSRKKAERTVNSYIRNARSLFSPRIVESIKSLELPSSLPFEEVALLPAGSMRYFSKIDPEALVVAAKDELGGNHPEQFKAFLLCLMLGLRRKEADLLMWRSIQWDRNVICIERNEYFTPKRETSLGEIPVEAELKQILREFYDRRQGPFVIESRTPPNPRALHEHYRANKHFKGLIAWLRSKGVEGTSPIHTLRKEFGRLITENAGIYAASKLLRHANIGITSAHYADDKRHVVSGLGSILVPQKAKPPPHAATRRKRRAISIRPRPTR